MRIGCEVEYHGKYSFLNISVFFSSEGGPLSEALNKVGGINAVAGLHDVFQISLSDKYYVRDILNVPGMPIAAAVTYASLYSKIQCPMC